MVKDDQKKTRSGANEKLHEKLSRKLLEKLELSSREVRISFRRICKLALWSYKELHEKLERSFLRS